MRPVWLLVLLTLFQILAGARVVARLARTARGERIRTSDVPLPEERMTVIVPVLNERDRLPACLAGLTAQPSEVVEILVVDGGSTDGTQELVSRFAARDDRVRLIDASPVPTSWNGKTHGLQAGLEHTCPDTGWILTVDADVRPEPPLARSLLAHARRSRAAAISVATLQRLSGPAEGFLHPALLTTLVYRFGIPGHATRRVTEVQANGQCCLFQREALEECGGFAVALASLCEDVTVARALAERGHTVGFYEADRLVSVAMYASWREAWQNWTRSLPLRDRYAGLAGWLGLVEIALTQALPLPLLFLMRSLAPGPRLARGVNVVLLMVRLGVLVGTASAYPHRPWSYWLSPLTDLPVTVQLWRSAIRRRHVWRGRLLIRDDSRDPE
ncbi:MAG TPA: glycosyltransferase family 2 protein [Thermomicrobiales bacterium]|nr:glycosyltransferase family 2 protein [Thermomicrobiales bacterium]